MKISIEEVKECEEVEIIIRCPIQNQDINKIIELLEHDSIKLQCKKERDIYQVNIVDILMKRHLLIVVMMFMKFLKNFMN